MKNRIIKTFSASGFGQIVTLLSQIALVPVFISALGVELYGEWLILFSIPLYISMADLGFSEYFNNKASMLYAKGLAEESLVVTNTGFFGTVYASVFLAFVLVFSFAFFDVWNVLNLDIISYFESFLIFSALCIYSLLCCVSTYLSSAFRIELRYATGIFVTNVIRVFELVGCFLVLISTRDLFFVSIAYAAIRLIGIIFLYNLLSAEASFICFSLKNFKINLLLNSAKESFSFALFPVSLILSTNGFSVIVGVVLGPGSVVVYNCLRTLTRVAFQFVNAVNSAVWQDVSYIYSRREQTITEIDVLMFKTLSISTVFSFLICFVLFLFGDYILRVWTNNEIHASEPIFSLMMIAVFLNVIWFSLSVFLRASNNHKSMFYFYFIAVVLSVCVSYPSIQLFGLNALGYILVALELIMIAFVSKEIIKLRTKYKMKVVNNET